MDSIIVDLKAKNCKEENFLKAKDLEAKGLTKEAIKYYKLSGTKEAYNNLGGIYAEIEEEYELSLEYYDKSLELDENYATVYSNKASLFYNIDEPEKALQEIQKALELGPDNYIFYYNKFIIVHNYNNNNLIKSLQLGLPIDETLKKTLKEMDYSSLNLSEFQRVKNEN